MTNKKQNYFLNAKGKIKSLANLTTLSDNATQLVDWLKNNKKKSELAVLLMSVLMFLTMCKNADHDIATENENNIPTPPIKIENAVAEETKNEIKQEHKNILSKTYKLDDENFIPMFIEENWFDIVAGLIELETWRGNTVTKHHRENRLTWLLGLTWVYEKNSKGQYDQSECTKKTAHLIDKMSAQEKWNQIKIHIAYQGECLRRIKNSLLSNGYKTMSAQQLLGLLFAGYQMPSVGPQIIEQLVDKNTEQEIADAFLVYPHKSTSFREGTYKRRWWCAMYYLGKINTDLIMNMKRQGFSDVDYETLIDANDITQEYSCKLDNKTIDSAINTMNTCKVRKENTVKQFMLEDPVLKQLYNNRYNQKNLTMNKYINSPDAGR